MRLPALSRGLTDCRSRVVAAGGSLICFIYLFSPAPRRRKVIKSRKEVRRDGFFSPPPPTPHPPFRRCPKKSRKTEKLPGPSGTFISLGPDPENRGRKETTTGKKERKEDEMNSVTRCLYFSNSYAKDMPGETSLQACIRAICIPIMNDLEASSTNPPWNSRKTSFESSRARYTDRKEPFG